jgi:hypothetical protein
MDRDETIALFLECEAERAEARAAGKSEDDAHEAAKAHWNAWAEDLLQKREALTACRDWKSRRKFPWEREEGENEETQAWLEAAAVDFSGCVIKLDARARGKETSEDFKEKYESAVTAARVIEISGPVIDLSGYKFPSYANFQTAIFDGETSLRGAIFGDVVWFWSVLITGKAHFTETTFKGYASFWSIAFSGTAEFEKTCFLGTAFFWSAAFSGKAAFVKTRFRAEADFALATFKQYAIFQEASFAKNATFEAIRSDRGFTMAGAVFCDVPNFIQAHFEEAPSLDDLIVVARQTLPARWRALKRLAIQGHDTDRELEFHAHEIRSQRYVSDWPLPSPPWRGRSWIGFWRFWFGVLYEIFSDFGRSALRPFLAWSLCIIVFAIYFLCQSPEIASKRKELHRGGFIGQVTAYSTVAFNAATRKPFSTCLSEEIEKDNWQKKLVVDGSGNGFTGLVDQVRGQTNLVNEALSIAYHNAVIVLDSSGDSAHRAFGCLYGVERYGGNPVAYVPRNVAIASGIQKLLSAIFIFLFGLAVRNMLKVK